MWFLPTYGRPANLRRLLEGAPGGLPPNLNIVLTNGDRAREDYLRILRLSPDAYPRLWQTGEGSRLADIFRNVVKWFPDAPFYGLLTDDHWPITPGWWEKLEKAAGSQCIAHATGFSETSPVPGPPCFGGDLVRAMGGLVPPGCECKHNYIDNIWRDLGNTFGLMRPLDDVVVEHRHWLNGRAEPDETHRRGSADIEEDRKRYEAWNESPDKIAMYERVAKLFGSTIKTTDLSKVKLVVCCPTGSSRPDIVYMRSIMRLMIAAQQRGLSIVISEVQGGSHVGKAREGALWQAMRQGATHILFVDDDMGFEPNLVFRLIAADHDFCAIPGVRKQDKLSLCVNLPAGGQEFHPITHFVKANEVGFAFVMLKRGTVERMAAAHPELKYNAAPGNDEWALFFDMIDGGERFSEDLSFCRRWRALGGEIWVDPKSAIIHAGRKEFTGCLNDLFKDHEKVEISFPDRAEILA